MKKLASLLLALVMLISCVPAMAEEVPADTEVTTPETNVVKVEIPVEQKTISVKADDQHTYAVYQIFTGSLYNNILSNVMYGENAAALSDTVKVGDLVPQAELDRLTNVYSATNTEKLDVIKTFVNLDSTSTPIAIVNATTPATVTTGYYLIVDKGIATTENGETSFDVPANEAYSLFVVQIVGDTTIAPKRGTVESFKKVDDEDDSVADDKSTEAIEGEDAKDWQDSADYDINDDVPFQLNGTLPENFDDYKRYYYAFHDVQSAGLTFNNDVKVYIDDVEIKEGFRVVYPAKDCTFEVIFDDLHAINEVEATSKIRVEYTAKLNENAIIGAEGNPNTMHLEYSNNPNAKYESTTKEDDDKIPEGGEKPTPETGKTPDDTVIVFTYKVVLNKVDEAGNPLTGAEFVLYKYDVNATTEDKWVEVKALTKNAETTTDGVTTPAGSTFTWSHLDAGNYKLVETKAPAGYNLLTAPIEFTIAAEHDITEADPKLISLTGNKADGTVVFTPDLTAASLTTSIENKPGAQLPSTGGMGTTILYVGGGILVLAAIVLLIVKRRANAE